MNGTLITYENNCMSLSCRGEMHIENNIVTSVYFKGYPRSYGDEWTGFYQRIKIGDSVTQEDINKILRFDGKRNVVSVFNDKISK